MMRIRSDRTPRPRRGIVLFLAVLAVLISVSPRAFAQEDAGIIGVVTDESGAVLPGVTVTVTSSALQVVADRDSAAAPRRIQRVLLVLGSWPQSSLRSQKPLRFCGLCVFCG